jgi:glycosyltransferase involved in cell wall biosynthesis
MLLRLLGATDRARFDAEVFSLKDVGVMGERMQRLGVRVRGLEMDPRRPNPLAVVKLARWLRDGRFDVVQTWMTHADLIGGAAARLARLPVAWGIHVGHLDRETHGRVALWTARLNARLSRFLPTRIVCCSELSRRVHESLGYRADKMVVIPNGFDLSQFKPDPAARAAVRAELQVSDGAVVIGQVGRFHAQKDHKNFFAAARALLKRHSDIEFVLCGRDVTWQNPQLCEWVGADRARFHILGERGDVARLTCAFDIACSSSSYGEAFPLVIGEAMACAVPCVVTDCGDSALMVGDTGRVVPIRDPDAFAAAVGALIAAGPDGRRALGAAARRRVEERYELSAIVGRYQSLYRELAGWNG